MLYIKHPFFIEVSNEKRRILGINLSLLFSDYEMGRVDRFIACTIDLCPVSSDKDQFKLKNLSWVADWNEKSVNSYKSARSDTDTIRCERARL